MMLRYSRSKKREIGTYPELDVDHARAREIIDGALDMNGDGSITAADDGTFEVLRASGGATVSLTGVRVEDRSPSPAPAAGLDSERRN